MSVHVLRAVECVRMHASVFRNHWVDNRGPSRSQFVHPWSLFIPPSSIHFGARLRSHIMCLSVWWHLTRYEVFIALVGVVCPINLLLTHCMHFYQGEDHRYFIKK